MAAAAAEDGAEEEASKRVTAFLWGAALLHDRASGYLPNYVLLKTRKGVGTWATLLGLATRHGLACLICGQPSRRTCRPLCISILIPCFATFGEIRADYG